MTDSFPDHVLLTLRVRILPSDVPGQARMKRALKALLRGYGCVCEDIRPLTDDQLQTTDQKNASGGR